MWQIKREPLLSALSVLNLVPQKLGVPSSEYIYARGHGSKLKLSLASYIAGEVEIDGKGDWPIKDAFYIDRRMFMPWILAVKEIKNKNAFEFHSHKKQLLLMHGTRKLSLDSQHKVRGYGNISKMVKGKTTSIPVSSILREMLLCGKNCAVDDPVVPHLNTVYVTKSKSGAIGMEAYASSDKVYFLGKGKLDTGRIKSSIPFPLYLITLLDVDGLKKITWVGKYIMLQFEHGLIWQPVSAEALENFPVASTRKYLAKSEKLPVTFVTSSKRFTRLMVRLGYYLQSVRRKDWVVYINGIDKEQSLKVSTSIPGAKFTEKISTLEKISSDFKLEWPLDVLQPVFEFLSKKTKKLAVTVRIDEKHGVSYLKAGSYWLAITSRQE